MSLKHDECHKPSYVAGYELCIDLFIELCAPEVHCQFQSQKLT